MNKTIIIIIVALAVILTGYFAFRGKFTQKTGGQTSSFSNTHNSIRNFVGH